MCTFKFKSYKTFKFEIFFSPGRSGGGGGGGLNITSWLHLLLGRNNVVYRLQLLFENA